MCVLWPKPGTVKLAVLATGKRRYSLTNHGLRRPHQSLFQGCRHWAGCCQDVLYPDSVQLKWQLRFGQDWYTDLMSRQRVIIGHIDIDLFLVLQSSLGQWPKYIYL